MTEKPRLGPQKQRIVSEAMGKPWAVLDRQEVKESIESGHLSLRNCENLGRCTMRKLMDWSGAVGPIDRKAGKYSERTVLRCIGILEAEGYKITHPTYPVGE